MAGYYNPELEQHLDEAYDATLKEQRARENYAAATFWCVVPL
jgi:hypothetical protein